MHSRLELHEELSKVFDTYRLYFQPPETIKMVYPCVVYELSKIRTMHANDKRYLNMKCYIVTIIDPNPDSTVHERMFELPYCSFDRFFTNDNLNHWVYTLYF